MDWSNLITTIVLYCCIVLMLLNWSLVSLYDHLPEANIIAIWQGWESGTYPIHSGMSRIFSLPQHKTVSTIMKLWYNALFSFMSHAIDRLLSFCWWKPILTILGLPTLGLYPGPLGQHSTNRPLSWDMMLVHTKSQVLLEL